MYFGREDIKCGRRDSNPHASRRQILSLVRLPITPLPQLGFFYCGTKIGIETIHVKFFYKIMVL